MWEEEAVSFLPVFRQTQLGGLPFCVLPSAPRQDNRALAATAGTALDLVESDSVPLNLAETTLSTEGENWLPE